jgi:hypothetical protein
MAEKKKKSKKISFKKEMKNVKKVKPKMRGRSLFSPTFFGLDVLIRNEEAYQKGKKYGKALREQRIRNAPKS